MTTDTQLKVTIRCHPDHWKQANLAISDFIRHKKPADGTAEGWIYRFDGLLAHARLTRAGNYSVVTWEENEE